MVKSVKMPRREFCEGIGSVAVSLAVPLRGFAAPLGTVNRKRSVPAEAEHNGFFSDGDVSLYCGDSLDVYEKWAAPTVIVSDGAYGILGFEGDTIDHTGIPEWYQKHIEAWSARALPSTTLWFWNSEIGWAAAHPVLEANGWRYQNCNVWLYCKS